jgi:Tol biopolymer transport system component
MRFKASPAASLRAAAWVSAVWALGCSFNPSNLQGGGSGGSHTIPGLTSLAINPTSAMLTLTDGGPPQSQQFRVTGMVNGIMQDLTSQVTWSATPSGVVSLSSNGLATTLGGSGGSVRVTASANGVSATAVLVVYYTFTGADPGQANNVPSDAATRFSNGQNDPGRAPGLVYPNDGTLFPPNITGIEVHFTPGNNNTLFQVSFVGSGSSINTFVRCTAPNGIQGCIYQPDPKIWSAVATSNAGLGPVALTVRGTDDNGTAVGASSTFHVRFARDNILGALYYWTTSGSTAIVRWDFAGSTQKAMPYLTPANTDGKTCVGCHALAPNGDKLVASAGGQNDGRVLLWNISSNQPQQGFPLQQRSQFESWNKDGTQFVGVYGDANPGMKGPSNLMIFDGSTGMVTKTIDLGGLRADHPDWSKNDGPDTIAFTSADPTAPTTDQRPSTGGIDYVRLNGGAWGAPQVLVPSELGKNRYYPNIAPDGNLVVYDESTCTSGTPAMGQTPDKSCDADTDATATIYLTSLSGLAPIALTRANSPGVADNGKTDLTNSFPRWAPFVQNLDESNKLIWLTFSSTRQYGLRTPPTSNHDESTSGMLLWMVGVNPGVGGADPSYAAFCLPFQDPSTSNHLAQWTKYLITGPG